MRVLIVDDDTEIRELLRKRLEHESFAVDTAGNGDRGSYLGRVNEYDLALVDRVMPGKCGPEVCKDIRDAGRTYPIIMLSVKADVEDRVEGLDVGADDYLAKPFSYRELRSRMQAVLRRPKPILKQVLEADDFKIDTATKRAFRDGRDLCLTRKEYALAEYLMLHRGAVVPRGVIMEHVWNDEVSPLSNTLEAHIMTLRKKVDRGSARKLIHTVPGRGYVIDPDTRLTLG